MAGLVSAFHTCEGEAWIKMDFLAIIPLLKSDFLFSPNFSLTISHYI